MHILHIHIYTHTHTPTCMKAHIYIQYNSQPHHAVTHTCRLGSLDSMLLDIFTYSTPCTNKRSGCSFFRIEQETIFRTTWQKHSQLLPTQKAKTVEECLDKSLASGKGLQMQQKTPHSHMCLLWTYWKVLFFFPVPSNHSQTKSDVWFENQSSHWQQVQTDYIQQEQCYFQAMISD